MTIGEAVWHIKAAMGCECSVDVNTIHKHRQYGKGGTFYAVVVVSPGATWCEATAEYKLLSDAVSEILTKIGNWKLGLAEVPA